MTSHDQPAAQGHGSYLTDEQVDTLAALVQRSDLPSHLADVVLACAFTTGTPPHELLAGLAANYEISDQLWQTVVGPEIAFALTERKP